MADGGTILKVSLYETVIAECNRIYEAMNATPKKWGDWSEEPDEDRDLIPGFLRLADKERRPFGERERIEREAAEHFDRILQAFTDARAWLVEAPFPTESMQVLKDLAWVTLYPATEIRARQPKKLLVPRAQLVKDLETYDFLLVGRLLTPREIAAISLLLGNWPSDHAGDEAETVETVIQRETKLIVENMTRHGHPHRPGKGSGLSRESKRSTKSKKKSNRAP